MVMFGSGRLEVACAAIDATPPAGTGVPVESKLETRVFALRQGDLCLGFANTDHHDFERLRKKLAAVLQIPQEQAIVCATGNESRLLCVEPSEENAATKAGKWMGKYARELDQAIQSLPNAFRGVHLGWGVSEQAAITYNAKGRLKSGEAYYVDEEQRLAMKRGYKGTIDPTASVLRFDDDSGAPALLLSHFTGRASVTHQIDQPIIHHDYCGVAVQELAKAFQPMHPVTAFLQGCSGDVHTKYSGGGPKRAREVGKKLGKSLEEAALGEHVVEQAVLGFAQATATIRYAPLPPASELEAERKEIEDFIRRCKAGALHVLSYRFSEGTPWQQRRTMGERLLHWTDWALQQVREGQPLPTKEIKLPLQIVTLSRDIALVFLPGEPFAGVGLTIRERSPFGLTIPVAWSNLTHPGIIPQGKDLEDGDQLSAAYRFHNRAQYTKPAGDMLAFKALELLNEMKEQIVRRG